MDRIMLLIGIAVILGTIGGRISARLRIPQVVEYIITGNLAVLAGGAWFHDITPDDIKQLEPISLFSQAGVAIGLAIFASHRFPYETAHNPLFLSSRPRPSCCCQHG